MATTTTVTAIREGNKREFTTEIWNQLPVHKYGWQLVAEEPEEVKALKNNGEGNTGSNNSVNTEGLNAADLAKKIYDAATIEEVNSLVVEGETRKTVLTAKEARLKQLSANAN